MTMMGPVMYVQPFGEAILQRLVSMAALKHRSTAVASDPAGKQGLLAMTANLLDWRNVSAVQQRTSIWGVIALKNRMYIRMA